MKKEINKIETEDCIIAILNNAPTGYEEMKSIAFRFNDAKYLSLLNLPKLKYLDVIQSFNDLSMHLTYEPLRQFFNNFIDGFKKTIKNSDTGMEVVDKINKALGDLIKMAEIELELSITGCMGLYGELLQLKELLLNDNDHSKMLSGWNRPAPANHDFDYESEAIEIKTVSKDKTTVKITSVYQLEAPVNKNLYLKIYRIESIDGSKTDSLGELYEEVRKLIKSESCKEEFILKCITDKIKYGGPRIITLPYKFIQIEEMKYLVNQETFPRIKRNILPGSISNISYRIDLFAIEAFKIIA
ncbi:MAG: PD-(D/E)XK motif protein [Ferruginibacter sp.]